MRGISFLLSPLLLINPTSIFFSHSLNCLFSTPVSNVASCRSIADCFGFFPLDLYRNHPSSSPSSARHLSSCASWEGKCTDFLWRSFVITFFPSSPDVSSLSHSGVPSSLARWSEALFSTLVFFTSVPSLSLYFCCLSCHSYLVFPRMKILSIPFKF